MDQNNAVRTIEDVAIKLKKIESHAHIYQKELQRMLDSKGEGSHRVINRWKKEIGIIVASLEQVEYLKIALVKDMNRFVAMKYEIELAEQKEQDWRYRSPLLKRSGKDKGAI